MSNLQLFFGSLPASSERASKPETNNPMDLGSYHQSDDEMGGKTLEKLTWRSDSNKNFSDWTIIVTSKSKPAETTNDQEHRAVGVIANKKSTTDTPERTSNTYHVHKAVLGLGPRSSKYFLRLFRTNGLSECETSTSRIELQPSEAKAFPAMLDFMYTYNSNVVASSETAVALRHLATYFGIPALYENVNQLIQDDMDKYNINIYLDEALLYNDDKIIDATIDVAIANWEDLFISKEKETVEFPLYFNMLPETKRVKLLAMQVRAYQQESRRFRRVTNEPLCGSFQRNVDAEKMPTFGSHPSMGKMVGDGGSFPMFLYDHNA